jgi:HEAT repeat protein
MPSRKIEQQLETLSELRKRGAKKELGPNEETVGAIRKALSDPVNVVVAKAAGMAAELEFRSLLPDLQRAFERLFKNGRKCDPQCWGKNAIAKALKDLGHAESADFLRGLHHVQMEPVWGGEEDTATVLRGTCALALVQCADITRAEIFRHLVNAFTDPIATVREDVARAIEQMEGEEAALLLRLKARLGDKEPPVTGQVFESLLRLERAAAVPFVAEFLGADEDTAEEAALTLGGSRLSSALDILIDAWSSSPHFPRSVLLRAISASRQESAIDFLVNVVRTGREREAIAALAALEFHRDSPEIRDKAAAAVETRSEAAIHDRFQQKFRSGE